MEAVSLVLDNRDKPTLVSTIADKLNVSLDSHKGIRTAPAYSRSRSMIKIQEGCNQICAYCIVPKVRGRERSIPPNEIISQVRDRFESGCQEVVLTGTQLGTYGFDLPGITLAGLLQKILASTDIKRLRISSLQAQEITPDLLALWDDVRLCPHFHIPLQSGSDTILKSMRRRYNTDQFKETVNLVRKTISDVAITTDIIVGFPEEGVKEFAESYSFAASMRFSDMHVFPYSIRPGTSAAYLDKQVVDTNKKERTGEMLELAAAAMRKFRYESIGQIRPVLWETAERNKPGHIWSGLTDNYLRVKANIDLKLSNTLTNTRLTGLDGDWMTGDVVPH
jgi:threonylcarbamoyladenosine tRNA methylthiotransferase MtaB